MNDSKLIKTGLFWNSINSFAKYGIVFLGMIFLARLLTPEDYGLVGILAVFISVADILVDSGLGGAVVRKKDVKSIDYSTLTVYNCCISLIVYLSFFILAPVVSGYYGRPILKDLLRLYSIVIIIHSFMIVPRVQLTKMLRFRVLSLINLASSCGGLIIAIILACNDFGVYSLIWQYVSSALISTILLFLFSGYKPKFLFSISSFKEQFSFGMNTTLANMMKTLSENIYANVIGKTSTLIQTGYYAQSSKLSTVPCNFLFNLIDSTFFPVFSQRNGDSNFANKLNEINKKAVCVIILFFIMIIPICKELIYILLGSKWLEAENTLRILIASGLFVSISNIGRNILKCIGSTFMILKVENVMLIINLCLLFLTSFWGYYYIVFSLLLASIIKSIYMNYIAYTKIGIKCIDFFRPAFFAFVVGIIGTLLAYLITYIELNMYISLFLKILTYISFICICFFREIKRNYKLNRK